jgi:hypothetical protein
MPTLMQMPTLTPMLTLMRMPTLPLSVAIAPMD